MKTYISAFPVDKQFQQAIGIYVTGYIDTKDIGKILHALINAGYIEISSYVECYDQTDDKVNLNRLSIHCTKPHNN